MTQHIGLGMTLQDLARQRVRFHLAPDAASEQELTLIEKQALVDQILSGRPIPQVEYDEQVDARGDICYMVTRGWQVIQALLDFAHNTFSLWTEDEKKQWQSRAGLQ